MMLFFAIVALIAALAVALVIGFANGMSDAPTGPWVSLRPVWILLAVAAGLFACWWFGWHPSW